MEIGRYNDLEVVHIGQHAVRLGEHDLHLPLSQLPEGTQVGDVLRVFVFTDSDDKPAASLRTPKAMVGDFAALEVIDVFEHGVFCDWGMPKDLFVPWSRQHDPLKVGDKVVVRLYLDHENRVIGATHLARFFDSHTGHLKVGQEMDLLVYGFNDIGAQVIADDKYSGLIYFNEAYQRLRIGDRVPGYLKHARRDGKLDLSLQRIGRGADEDAQQRILEALDEAGGHLRLKDKSSPAAIQQHLNMSKKAFKRAVGGLYKAGHITLGDDGIRLVQS